jgi:DNA-binding response OmpR family regulator
MAGPTGCVRTLSRKEPARALRCPVTLMHLDEDPRRRDAIRRFFHEHACFVRDGDDWEAMVEDFRYMSFDALLIGFERTLPDGLLASIEQLRTSRRVPIVVLSRSVTHDVESIALQLKALTVAAEPYDLDDIYARLCEALVEREQ